MPPTRRLTSALVAMLVTASALALAGCKEDLPAGVDPAQVDAVEAPELGACRDLTIKDVSAPSNATKVVDCGEVHTAQTYAVGAIPDELTENGLVLRYEVEETRRGAPRDLAVPEQVVTARDQQGKGDPNYHHQRGPERDEPHRMPTC